MQNEFDGDAVLGFSRISDKKQFLIHRIGVMPNIKGDQDFRDTVNALQKFLEKCVP